MSDQCDPSNFSGGRWFEQRQHISIFVGHFICLFVSNNVCRFLYRYRFICSSLCIALARLDVLIPFGSMRFDCGSTYARTCDAYGLTQRPHSIVRLKERNAAFIPSIFRSAAPALGRFRLIFTGF